MSDTPQDKAEAARVRRRWLTLGELLGIAAVIISAATFWNSYRERTNAETERHSSEAKSEKVATILTFRASADRDGRTLTLTPRADNQTVQSQTLTFPSAFGIDPIETTGDARIERNWFADGLVKARKGGGISDDTVGDAHLPVAITTHYLVDGEPREDRTLYRIGYSASHAFLSGTTIKLKGLSRQASIPSDAAAQKQVDAAWQAGLPKP